MYRKMNKQMSILLICSCVLFVGCHYLSQWDLVIYKIREISYLIINILFYVIPLELLITIFSWFKYMKEKENYHFGNSILTFLSIISTCLCVSFFIIIFYTIISEGFIKDFKISNNNGYFIVINNEYIPITQEQYSSVDTTKLYHFKYEYNKILKVSKLIEFEIDK